MLIGYMRVSKGDGSQVLDLQRDALLAGLGIGTMPQRWIEEDIKAGRLKVISPEYRHQIQVVLAWRRDTMGKAKSWLVREIPKLFAGQGE